MGDPHRAKRRFTEAASVAAHALERASADLELAVKTAVTNVTRQHDLDVSAPLAAAVQAVGIATTALHVQVAMAKAEDLGNTFWSQGYKAKATIQRQINKSADTQAWPDLSETDATIAMIQAK